MTSPLNRAPSIIDAFPDGVEKLPELELRQVMKSEAPVNKESNLTKEVVDVLPWNNYTLVTLKDGVDVAIFDKAGKPVTDLKMFMANCEMIIDWSNDRVAHKVRGEDLNKRYISRHIRSSDNVTLSNVPSELQPFASAALDSSSVGRFDLRGTSNTKLRALNMATSGRYIVLSSPQGAYFAFETENESSVVLEPRNWKRIDPKDTIPPELAEFAKNSAVESHKYLNDKYWMSVASDGINIVKNGDGVEKAVFSDRILSVNNNIAKDPNNPNIVYYCKDVNPEQILRLDLSGEPNTWSPTVAELPKQYDRIDQLQMDPTGSFLLFSSREDQVFLAKDTLQEVKRMPKLSHVSFDSSGNIRAIDGENRLVILEANFREIAREIDSRKIAKLASGVDLKSVFAPGVTVGKEATGSTDTFEHLSALRTQYETEFASVLGGVTTLEGIQGVREGLGRLNLTLRIQGLQPDEATFIVEGLEGPVAEKEREFAVKAAREGLDFVRARLGGSISLSSMSEARAEMGRVKASEALLDADLRREVRDVGEELERKSLELFSQKGGEVIRDVESLVVRTKLDLEAFTKKSQMDDWLEFIYPQLRARLGSIARDVPLEAVEAYSALVSARARLQEMADVFERKFKQEYAKVREVAVERLEATVGTIQADLVGLLERLRSKEFTDRRSAEEYLQASEARKAIEAEVTAMAGSSPDISKELNRALRVGISNALTDIDRGSNTSVAASGQQMITFGKTDFPKWEAKVKAKVARKVEVVFDDDPSSHGPGLKPADILGDVALSITTATGKTARARLYEGWDEENEWRLAPPSYRGTPIPPSYLTAGEFRKVRRDYGEWSRGDKSQLQDELKKRRVALREIYEKRERTYETNSAGKNVKLLPRTSGEALAIREEYKTRLNEYGQFCAENNIHILKRIDRVQSEPDAEYTNGKGYVPEWQSHWTNDPQADGYLEEMAQVFKMQLDLQEGMLDLKGHAGTGKDVLIKMFCARTNRPYFAIDCTRWTTEAELSEDVILQSVDGASQTVMVPSAVLNGITTPGAVVYFNEFTAMPEQAQIFLHALLDEKRSLTLKTQSGKTVRAEKTILLAASENPDYPGTFTPQFATRSRMVGINVKYPPFTRLPGIGDTNPNPPYDVSEALRIARGVDSLADLTYEASLDRNEFVKIWDRYVNGIENGALEPTGTVKFDIDTILALVQFTNKLRTDFIKNFEKSREKNLLPIRQPLTGRELRRCANALSKIPPEEKVAGHEETVARDLLERYFLSHIDKDEDRTKIKTAMDTWTSRRRLQP